MAETRPRMLETYQQELDAIVTANSEAYQQSDRLRLFFDAEKPAWSLQDRYKAIEAYHTLVKESLGEKIAVKAALEDAVDKAKEQLDEKMRAKAERKMRKAWSHDTQNEESYKRWSAPRRETYVQRAYEPPKRSPVKTSPRLLEVVEKLFPLNMTNEYERSITPVAKPSWMQTSYETPSWMDPDRARVERQRAKALKRPKSLPHFIEAPNKSWTTETTSHYNPPNIPHGAWSEKNLSRTPHYTIPEQKVHWEPTVPEMSIAPVQNSQPKVPFWRRGFKKVATTFASFF